MLNTDSGLWAFRSGSRNATGMAPTRVARLSPSAGRCLQKVRKRSTRANPFNDTYNAASTALFASTQNWHQDSFRSRLKAESYLFYSSFRRFLWRVTAGQEITPQNDDFNKGHSTGKRDSVVSSPPGL